MFENKNIKEVLNKYYPSEWTGSNTNTHENYYEEIDILPVNSLRFHTAMSQSFCEKIKRITRVENLYLYGCFLLKQAEYKCKGTPFTIKELYHDTGDHKVDSILKTNLDWRLVKRNKFGTGVSFSPCTAYANKQSSRLNGTSRAMIIADVVVGHCQNGSIMARLPDDGYDTTVGNCSNVYVKFYDNEFYPKYVVYYDSVQHDYRCKRYRF